jgi:hypothetical protein
MAFDAGRGRAVVFGGRTLTSAYGDTWEWNGVNWVQRSTSPSPGARHQHAMAYDWFSGRSLLYGGVVGTFQVMSDTWAWDGVAWQQLAAAGPGGRGNHVMAADSGRRRVVLFGGYAGISVLGDTWEWDGQRWSLITVSGPVAREAAAMVYDSRRSRAVLFGGTAVGQLALADTWEWDGAVWVRANVVSAPPGRARHSLAYDAARGRSICYGGFDGNGRPLTDTWEWDGIEWMQVSPAQNPGLSQSRAMVFDSVRQRTVLVGSGIGTATWEYFAACSTVGPGSVGGGAPMQCLGMPQVGQRFCLAFQNGVGGGLVVIGRAPPLWPTPVLLPPLFCRQSLLYSNPSFVSAVAGTPGQLCVSLANDPGLVGQAFCLQGFSLTAAMCLEATDGVVVIVQP